MKKFVKPEFVQCPTPDLKFGNYELQLEGRVIDYWCEDGWTLVPDEFASAACILGKNFNQKSRWQWISSRIPQLSTLLTLVPDEFASAACFFSKSGSHLHFYSEF